MNLQKKIITAVLCTASFISFSQAIVSEDPKLDVPVTPAPVTLQPINSLHTPLLVGEAPVCLLNAIGNYKYVMTNYNRVTGEGQVLSIPSALTNPIVSEEHYMLFSAKKRAERIYIPERPLGKLLKNIMDPQATYFYKGKPIIDEFNKGYSFRLNFSNALQPHEFASLLRDNESLLVSHPVKPLLYLQSHPITAFSNDERKFLSTYFTIDDSTETRSFFVKSQKEFDDIDASGFSEEYKTSWEAIYNHALADCKKFKTEKIVPAFFRDVIPGLAKSVVKAIIVGKVLESLYYMTASEKERHVLDEAKEKAIKETGSYIHEFIKSARTYTTGHIPIK